MDNFEKKVVQINALKTCYDLIEEKVQYELYCNCYKADNGETLEDWKVRSTEAAECTIEVYRTIQQYIERFI